MSNKLVSPSAPPKRHPTVVTHHTHQENINKSPNSPQENIELPQFYLSQPLTKSDRTHTTNQFPEGTSPSKREFLRNFNLFSFNKLKKNSLVLTSNTVDTFDENRHISLASAQVSPPSQKKEVSSKMKRFFLNKSTLKDTPATKSPDTDSKTTTESNTPMQDTQTLPSLLVFFSKQNEKLLRENATLKKQLNEIKLNLSMGAVNKKEEILINPTKSLNRQNGVVVELRMKEELLSKKVAALEGLVTSKDEEIRFLNNKLAQSEEQLKDYQKKSEANLNLLKEKISFVLELYQDLQIKFSSQEVNNQLWQQQWQHQKDSYLARISFLEGYISTKA